MSVYLSLRHGWGHHAEFQACGILNAHRSGHPHAPAIRHQRGQLGHRPTAAVSANILLGNLLSAATVLLMGLVLNVGNLRFAAIEIPFLLLPLALIWLKHPLAK